MKKIFTKIYHETKIPRVGDVSENQVFWLGASLGLLFFALSVAMLSSIFMDYGIGMIPVILLVFGVSMGSFFLFRWLSTLVLHTAMILPRYFFAAFGSAIGLLMVLRNIRFYIPAEYFYVGGFILLWATAIAFGSIFVLIFDKRIHFNKSAIIGIGAAGFLSTCLLILSLFWLKSEGSDPYSIDFTQVPLIKPVADDLPDPTIAGSHTFTTFTYGSGTNRQRAEFGADVKFPSETVDGTYILPQWKGKNGRERERYWGFGLKEWPLNGMVWLPEGAGKFPLVLIVHGNHSMTDYSDPGYAYLAEMLASQGYAVVSVDENFLNGAWSGDFRGKELPARAWLLLKHVEQWRKWTNDPDHPLFQTADVENVILIGHSRGGEAVPIAAAFNTLPYFPDDARVTFDFNFGIKGVVAIAPTDYRYDRRVTIQNVNYLSLQGSYDSDEDSFFGLRQMQRTVFTDSGFHIKAGLYLHGANHGQFNTGWGRYDSGFPFKYFLNTAPIITGELQRSYAKIAISVFTKATLNDDFRYLPVLQDIRQAESWMDETTPALSFYEDTDTQTLVDFEEDINITTTAIGAALATDMTIWLEDYLQYRGGLHQENNVVVLGWQRDSLPRKPQFELSFHQSQNFSTGDALRMSLGAGDPTLLQSMQDDSLQNSFLIVLQDSLGNTASLKIDDYQKISPRWKIRFLKTKALTLSRHQQEWEPILATFIFPFNSFEKIENIDLNAIVAIKFLFDPEKNGVVMMDDIGLQRL